MVLPLLDEAPLTPEAVAVHANVVPVTVLDKLSAVVFPEQIVVGPVEVVVGRGLTMIEIVMGVPVQPAATGVTV